MREIERGIEVWRLRGTLTGQGSRAVIRDLQRQRQRGSQRWGGAGERQREGEKGEVGGKGKRGRRVGELQQRWEGEREGETLREGG